MFMRQLLVFVTIFVVIVESDSANRDQGYRNIGEFDLKMDDRYGDLGEATCIRVNISVVKVTGTGCADCLKAEEEKSEVTTLIVDEGITTLPNEACMDWVSLSNVHLPSTLIALPEKGFCNCSALVDISLSDSCAAIGARCFYYCSALTRIRLGADLDGIGREAFGFCGLLSDIEFSTKITKIGTAAFLRSGLTNLSLPDSVLWVGESCFAWCLNLTQVRIGENLPNISAEMFRGCANLQSISIGNSVTNIGIWAFMECSSLRHVSLGCSVQVIEERSFQGSALTSISLPDSISSVGPLVFDTPNLSILVIGPNLTYFNFQALGQKSSLSEVHIRSAPFASNTSICAALRHCNVSKTVRLFVGGGYSGTVCNRSVEIEPTMSAAPSRSVTPTASRSFEPTRSRSQTSVVTRTVTPHDSNKRKLALGLGLGLGLPVVFGVVGVVMWILMRTRRSKEVSVMVTPLTNVVEK
jgi:hypothetical protein